MLLAKFCGNRTNGSREEYFEGFLTYITGVIQKVLPVLSTCVVTAYLVVDRVLRFPTEQYGDTWA